MKKFIVISLSIILFAFLCACEKINCSSCGENISSVAAFCEHCGIETSHTHSFLDATCTEAKTCSCGVTEGSALGHKWMDATCEEPKTCSVCEKTEGSALGHKWMDAACEVPMICSVCEKTRGLPLAHVWVPATKTTPKTCSLCKQIDEQDEITKNWFVNQYNIAQSEYISSLESIKAQIEAQIDNLNEEIRKEYIAYRKQIDIYIPNYINGNGLGEGTKYQMIKKAEESYSATVNGYKGQINSLQGQIDSINAEIENPNVDFILSLIAEGCNISSQEVYQYYSLYKNCI